MNSARGRTGTEESGFASLVIAMVLVLVLSLTTVGFAQLMRKEQRSALDKQLSNQAYYAAETGVNDAAKAINNGYTIAKTKCGPYSNNNPDSALNLGSITDPASKTAATDYLTDNTVSPTTNSAYTCLTIDPTPETLEYRLNDTSKPRSVQLTGVDNANPTEVKQIGSLVISWEDIGGANTSYVPNTSYNFTPTDEWTYVGPLRLGLTPLTSNGLGREKLTKETYTAFLFPNKASSPNVLPDSLYGSAIGKAGGAILNGNCNSANTPRDCSVRITDLNQASFLLRLIPIYRSSDVTIRAYGTDNTQLRIKNAQTLVDSTGRAEDVLRRIQVRIPTQNNYDIPDGTEATQALCKQLQLIPGGATPGRPAECPVP